MEFKERSNFKGIPAKLKQVFEVAEIARFTPEQVLSYEDSLKYYRDMKNSLDTAYDEGREEGSMNKLTEIALNAIKAGLENETIAGITGVTVDEVEALRK